MNLGGYFKQWTGITLAVSAIALGVAIPTSPAVAARVDSGQSNPDFAASCGTDVVVVIDESRSIYTEGAVGQVESAVTALANGLVGTGSRMRLVEFGSNARDVILSGGTGFQSVSGSFVGQVSDYFDGTNTSSISRYYNPNGSPTSAHYTNWEAALNQAATANNDDATVPTADGTPLVVFITDGDPTTSGTSGTVSGGSIGNENANADAAIQEMARLQNAGSHVLSIAVGTASTNNTSYGRLTNLTEPGTFQQWVTGDDPNQLDIRTVDALRVGSFSALEAALSNVVYALCGSSLTINKVDEVGNPIVGRDFTLTIDSVAPGSTMQWEVPGPAIAAENTPSSRTNSTNGNGIASFKWTPGSLASPQPWNSVVHFTETLPTGWSLGAVDCSIGEQSIAVSTSVVGNVVTFGPFTVDRADAVACDIENIRSASITIVKDTAPLAPNDPTDFGFSTTSPVGADDVLPPSFLLDDDTDATLPDRRTFTVDPGTYTVAENDPSGIFWELTGLTCGNTVGSPTANTNLASRSVQLIVAAGDQITCTFTNRQVPPPQLVVTKSPSPASFQEKNGSVTYTVSVSNPNGATDPVTISAISETVTFGGNTSAPIDLTQPAPSLPVGSVTSNTCPSLLGAAVDSSAVSCSFTVSYTGHNAGDQIDDIVTVSATDQFGRSASEADDASVLVTPRPPQLVVEKQNVEPVAIVAPGGAAIYSVAITNPAAAIETVTIDSIVDQMSIGGSPFGAPLDILTPSAPVVASTCTSLLGTVLDPGQNVTCQFTVDTSQIGALAEDDELTNTITVGAHDDDPTPQTVTATDDASRTVLGEPPSLGVLKTDGGAIVTEPGEAIVYTFDIYNLSVTEPLEIIRIVDHVEFNNVSIGSVSVEDLGADNVVDITSTLAGASLVSTTCDAEIGTILAPAAGLDADGRPTNADATTTCTMTLALPANASDVYDDQVVVDAQDDEGVPVQAENSASTPAEGIDPAVQIVKTPSPTSVPETGGTVTFSFEITNTSLASTDPITLTDLDDDVFGDLFDAGNALVDNNSCPTLVGVVLAQGVSVNCSFTADVAGTVPVPHVNTATVTAVDDEGVEASDQDDATVTFTDVAPTIVVTKTANPTVVPESGADVTYTVTLQNTSQEIITLTSLTDDKFGDLTLADGTCDTGADIAPGATYECQFTEYLLQIGAAASHTNVVTGTAVDDEGTEATDDDDATVTYQLIPPTVTVTKTDGGADVAEPGGVVTYDLVIENTSFEAVTITSLLDVISYENPVSTSSPLDLLAAGGVIEATTCTGATLAPADGQPGGADEIHCSFDARLSGTSQIVSDVVTVVVVDDDQQTGTDHDTESTPITDVPASVSITKTASPNQIAAGSATDYTFTIQNESTIEPIFVIALEDDKFGDLSVACGFSLATPVELAPKGQAGDSTDCVLSLTPVFGASGVHTNVATVSAADDELLALLRDPGEGGASEPLTASDDETVSATGSISVTKIATPTGQQDFDFDLTGQQTQTAVAADGYPELTWSGLLPGGYDLTESPVAGWDLKQVACTLDGTPVDLAAVTDGVTVLLDWGDVVSCEFSNVERGQIVVEKSTHPDGDQTAFDFESSYGNPFALSDGESQTSALLEPGVYTVSEPAADGWSLTALECTSRDGGSGVQTDNTPNDLDGATATIDLAAGDVVHCTFTNTKRGAVTITKSVAAGVSQVSGVTHSVTYDVSVTNTGGIAEPFTITDALDGFGLGATIDHVSAGAVRTSVDGPAANAAWDGDTDAVVAAGSIDAGATYTYQLTVEFDIEPSMGLVARQCGTTEFASGAGAYNEATVTYGDGATNRDWACDDMPDPSITVTKVAAADQPVLAGGHTYTAAYTVQITNDGEGPGEYDLVETPMFGDGTTVTNVSIVSTDPVVSIDLPIAGPLTPINVVTDQALLPGATHSFEVVVTFDVAGAMTTEQRDCTVGQLEAGTGTWNRVDVFFNGLSGDAHDCSVIPDPLLTLDKQVTGELAHVGGYAYTVSYELVVGNDGDGPGVYSLSDTPMFGDGVTITNIAVSGTELAATIDGYTMGSDIVADHLIDAHTSHSYTVTVSFTVAGDSTAAARDCDLIDGEDGTGTLNEATVRWNGPDLTDTDCADIPEPQVTIEKTVATPTLAGDGTWTVVYELHVMNDAAAGPASYDLVDTPKFAVGVTIDEMTVTSPELGSPIVVADPTSPVDITTGHPIEQGGHHVYTVTAVVSIAVSAELDGDCISVEGENTGLLNSMSITVRGEQIDDSACAPISTLTLVKEVVNDDGGNAAVADVTLTATGATTISGTSPVSSAVPAGLYALTETPLPGYTTDGFVCVGGEQDGDLVGVPAGGNVVCTIVNDDDPINLVLTKTDHGFETLAGGDPIPYTITIQNVGTRDVDQNEPVVLTDDLPEHLSFRLPVPAGCTVAARTLTCEVDPALLTAGASALVYDLLVDVAPDAPAGSYQNLAWVTTDDDPVCGEAECPVPPTCDEAGQNDNVDCEDTPIERYASIFITKTDNVADGVAVNPGQTFSYDLVVGNGGPSTVLSNLTVDDDLPAQLSLVSVTAPAGWSCNTIDPVKCVWGGGPVFPGDVLPSLTVNVRVTADATGDTIHNVAIATALVDVLPEFQQSIVTVVGADFGGIGDVVTAQDDETTPLQSFADLAIVKSASVQQIAQGGTFTWTLDVRNIGPGTARNVVVGDIVPSTLTVTGVSSTDFTCTSNGNTVSCTTASMAVGAAGKITISVTVKTTTSAGQIVNVGSVESDTPDPDLTNNSDDAAVTAVQQIPPTVPPPPPVTLPKTGSSGTAPMLSLGFALLGAGLVVLVASRRRRPAAV